MGFLESVYRIENQQANQWELFIEGAPEDLVYKVQDVSLPMYKLTTETKYTGEKVYKTLEEPNEITMTIREDVKFQTFKFFNKWFDAVFDLKTRTFRKQTAERKNIKDVQIKFLRPNFTALNVPFTGSVPFDIIPGFEISKVSNLYHLKQCKIVGVDSLSLDYSGNPLLFSITLIPEEIEFLTIS